jgi:hypothetical protein
LSSAILYLAIVAIWAVVLVPRWLRPRPAQPVPVSVEPAGAGSGGAGADISGAAGAGSASPGPEGAEPAAPGRAAAPAWTASAEPSTEEPLADEPAADASAAEAGDGAAEEVAAPSPGVGVVVVVVVRRAEIVKARRRLLTTLITLTVIAVALVVTRIDAYWIVIPPAVLLTGYVVLLRQFAHMDAEQARRAARIRRAHAQAGRAPVPAAAPAVGEPDLGSDAPAAPGGAEIIDISGRIGDQVYDQYSDAANRAVGD